MDKVAPGNGIDVEYLDMSKSHEEDIRNALKPNTKVRPCPFILLKCSIMMPFRTAVGLGRNTYKPNPPTHLHNSALQDRSLPSFPASSGPG